MKFSVQRLRTLVLNTNFIIWAILIPAAVLRLYRIQDYMTFLGDEGRDVLVVYNILHGKLTLLGPTASVGGFFLGPIYYYMMAPFLWIFNYNPVGPAVMVALFGIATVWLVYKMGSEFFNQRVGIIAASLYAISPLIIAYSRSSWNPNVMPFFSMLTLFILYKAAKGDRAKLFIISGILLGITMQLHYLATFLGVIIAGYILTVNIFQQGEKGLKKVLLETSKKYFFILLGFMMGLSPFLAFEVRHGMPNIQSIISFIFSSGDTGANINFLKTVNDIFFRLFARLLTNFPPSEQISLRTDSLILLWYSGALILGAVSILTFLHKYFNLFKTKQILKEHSADFFKLSLIFLWFVLGIGLFGFYKKSIYDYYFGFMFPLPFFLIGNTLDFFIKRNKIFTIFSIGIFLGLIALNLNGVPFRHIPNRQLKQVETISRFVVDKAGSKPFNFALVSGSNSDHAYRYFFTLWNRSPVTILNPQTDPERASVARQLIIVCETLPCHPLGHSLWEIAGFGQGEIVGEWDVIVVKVYKLVHFSEK